MIGRSVREPWPIACSRSRCSGPPDAVIPYYYWVVSAGLVKQLVCVPELGCAEGALALSS